MSGRLTKEWTATSEEAFGASGAKGDKGEDFLMEVFSSWGWHATCHRGLDSKAAQVTGVDITFQNPKWVNSYTCDVKANLNDSGVFYVETHAKGWLFNPKKTSNRIWHVNPSTGWMAWYGREEMKAFILKSRLQGAGLYKITPGMNIPFIQRQRVKLVAKPAETFDDVPY